jgi:hypothetical protein
MKKFLLLGSFLFFTVRADGQSLDRLKERAAAFWTERLAGNQPAYLKFVEPSGADALRGQQARYLRADLTAIEFGTQPNTATVVTNVRVMLPDLGEVKREIRDVWVWNGKNWFLRPQEVSLSTLLSGGSTPLEAAKALPPLTFVPSPSQINLGKHVQGEVLSAKLSFKTDRDRIGVLLPGDLPGVTYGPIEWKDKETGIVELTIDTILMSQDVVKPLIFKIVDITGKHELLKPVPLLVQIEGRIDITQNPPIVDPDQSGTVELSLQNLTGKPIRITSVASNNESFVLDPEVKVNVGPQESTTTTLTYSASNNLGGASVAVRFAEAVLGRTTISIPIQIQEHRTSRPPTTPQPTPQQMEEIRRQNPNPKPPPK